MNLKSILTTIAALVATATLSLAEQPEHKTGMLECEKTNKGYATQWISDSKRPRATAQLRLGGGDSRTPYLCTHTNIYCSCDQDRATKAAGGELPFVRNRLVPRRIDSMLRALRSHWPEYFIEATLLGSS